MEKKMIEQFIERVKKEANIHKFLKEDMIYQLIAMFHQNYKKMEYPKMIKNPLEMALEFYKFYNQQYYLMIIEALKNGRIVIDPEVETTFTDTNTNITFIKPVGHDRDVFMMVHEFAHFIDRNSKPFIIPDEYNFLCEVFSFYMERQLELWLMEKGYDELIKIRRNNRLYYEEKMIRVIQ